MGDVVPFRRPRHSAPSLAPSARGRWLACVGLLAFSATALTLLDEAFAVAQWLGMTEQTPVYRYVLVHAGLVGCAASWLMIPAILVNSSREWLATVALLLIVGVATGDYQQTLRDPCGAIEFRPSLCRPPSILA